MQRWMIIGLILLVAALPALAGAASLNLSPKDAVSLQSQRRDLFLLDVRTEEEYRQFRLEGAKLIPIDRLTVRLAEIPRNRPVLVYCAVGSRSSQVANYLVRQGYTEVYNLYGGIYSWSQQGLPVLQGGP